MPSQHLVNSAAGHIEAMIAEKIPWDAQGAEVVLVAQVEDFFFEIGRSPSQASTGLVARFSINERFIPGGGVSSSPSIEGAL